jgi:hypothetical protein
MTMDHASCPCDDPRQAEPALRNRRRPKNWSTEGLERLRAAAWATRPWELTRGPTTAAGKARSAANGRSRQKGEKSVRQLRAELASVLILIEEMGAARRSAMAVENDAGIPRSQP